jgi:hypothetical protein
VAVFLPGEHVVHLCVQQRDTGLLFSPKCPCQEFRKDLLGSLHELLEEKEELKRPLQIFQVELIEENGRTCQARHKPFLSRRVGREVVWVHLDNPTRIDDKLSWEV